MPLVETVFICVECETGYFYCPKQECQTETPLLKHPKTFESAIINCRNCGIPLWISFKTMFALTECSVCEENKNALEEIEIDA